MFKLICPNCNMQIIQCGVKLKKKELRWYEFTQFESFCPHCQAKVEIDRKAQVWTVLILPFVVLLVWDAVAVLMKNGGVEINWLWGSGILGFIGIGIAIVKRRLVLVEKPSN